MTQSSTLGTIGEMALPQPAMVVPREIIHETISLQHKPGASIHYSYAIGTGIDPILVVFLNGLMADKSSWLPVMAGIIRERKGTSPGFPSMLAYDRYGQGLTENQDPQDSPQNVPYGHDCKDAAKDLHQMISQAAEGRLSAKSKQLRIVLVCNSIGCAIGRLYAEEHPVAALLLLDSIIANSNFDFWPNPDAFGFDATELPEDVTIDILREQRAKFAAIFHPNRPNKEGLSRRNLAQVLPYSDRPKLGSEGDRPWVTVVGHDFEAFAAESLRTMGTPLGLSMKYSNVVWNEYNEGLVNITSEEKSKGPIQAKGCGHFIQRDDPQFVIGAALDLVDKIRMDRSAVW